MKAYLFFKRLLVDQRGLETVEYAIVGALLCAVAAVAIGALGLNVAGKFDQLVVTLT